MQTDVVRKKQFDIKDNVKFNGNVLKSKAFVSKNIFIIIMVLGCMMGSFSHTAFSSMLENIMKEFNLSASKSQLMTAVYSMTIGVTTILSVFLTKYFDKKKISIFVLGRRRGNYSGNGPYPYECAWSQWYQIMYAASYLRQENEFTISNLYKLIVSTSPFNIKISEKPVTFCYGKYRIKFGGKTFCGKDTR